MATLAATATLADARLFYQDDNTAGNALTDAQLYEIVNEVYQSYAAAYPERFVIRADSMSTYFTSGVGTWVPSAAYGVGGISVLASAVTAAGSGYAVGDILNITTGGTGATCRVATLSGSGVATVSLLQRGVGYTSGAGKVTTHATGAGNDACTVNITSVTSTSGFNVRRVLAMRIGTTNLERYEPHRIYEMTKNDATAGTLTRYALIQDNSSATMTTLPNVYTVLLYPIPADGAQTILTDYEHYPTDLAAGTDLLRGLGDAESRWIPRLVAAKAAWLNGKDPAFIGGILDGVDKDMLAAMNVKAGLLAPRQRSGEVPV
jgi:hypothetical protein